MATAFFANIGYFLTASYIGIVLIGLVSDRREAFISATCVGLLCITAWIPAIWTNPANMAAAHLGILGIMLIFLHGRWAKPMIAIMLVALVADALWTMMPAWNLQENAYKFPYSVFWWQSILNGLFVSQCVLTLLRCYNSPEPKGKPRVKFYARRMEDIHLNLIRRG